MKMPVNALCRVTYERRSVIGYYTPAMRHLCERMRDKTQQSVVGLRYNRLHQILLYSNKCAQIYYFRPIFWFIVAFKHSVCHVIIYREN